MEPARLDEIRQYSATIARLRAGADQLSLSPSRRRMARLSRSARAPPRSGPAAPRPSPPGAATLPIPSSSSRRRTVPWRRSSRSVASSKLALLARDLRECRVGARPPRADRRASSASSSASVVNARLAPSRRRARGPCRARAASAPARALRAAERGARSSRWRPCWRNAACAASPARRRYSRFFVLAIARARSGARAGHGPVEVVRLGALDVVGRPAREGRPEARTGRLSYATSWVTTCLNMQAGRPRGRGRRGRACAQRVEVAEDVVESRRAPDRRRAASAPRTRGRRRSPPSSYRRGALGRGVDAAQDQRVEAVRQPDRLDRGAISGVDVLGRR